MTATRRWLFDLGNSRLKCAQMDTHGRLGDVIAIAHDGAVFPPDWVDGLPARIETAAVASVATDAVHDALIDVLAARCDAISQARTQPGFGGIRVAYAEPERLGVDRFLALLAARARGHEPALVVGVGTALTVDWLDADGSHRGGRIAPSPSLMRAALHARAAQLPERGGDYAEFADGTEAALASGCLGAALALVERSLRVAEAATGVRPRLLLHGGGCTELIAQLPDAVAAPNLVLEGLAQWSRDRDS